MEKVTADRFEWVIKEHPRPLLVEFFTEWSGSAFIVSEMLYGLEEPYGDRVFFTLVNCDEPGELCRAYGVQKIPTILFFREGEVVDQLVGTPSRREVEHVLERMLAAEADR